MKNNIDQIVDLIERRELFLFVGAAISIAKPSGLLGFRDLQNEVIWALCQELETDLRNTYEHIYSEIKYEIVTSEIASKFLRIAPEYLFLLCKRGMLRKEKTNDYYYLQPLNTFRNSIPNQNHLIIAKLLTGGHIPAIFTTNFDLLLESAIDQLEVNMKNKSQIVKYWRTEHFNETKGDNPKIFKLHGSIDDFESVIISLDEIGKRATFGKLKSLKYFLENYYVLFLGYRGADLDIFSYLASTKCRGIIWNDLSEENILPKVKNLLKKQNGSVITGDLNNIFSEISTELNLDKLEVNYDIKSESINIEQKFVKWASEIDILSRIIIIGDIWEYLGEWATGMKFFVSGLKLCKRTEDKPIENTFLGRLAGVCYKTERFGEVKRYCHVILHNAKGFAPVQKLSEYIPTLQLLGLIEAQVDLKKGIKLIIESLEYQEQLEEIDPKTRWRKGEILQNAGNIFYKAGVMDEAMENFKGALKIYDEFGNVHGRAAILGNMGSILLTQAKYEDCIDLYGEAKYLYMETGDVVELSLIILNLAYAYYEKGMKEEAKEHANIAKAFFNMLSDKKRYTKATELLNNL